MLSKKCKPSLWKTFQQADSPAMVTVYANRDGYSRSNVCVDDYGHVTAYDPARTTPHLNGVELGYALMTREVLDYLPSANVSFDAGVPKYPCAAASTQRASRS